MDSSGTNLVSKLWGTDQGGWGISEVYKGIEGLVECIGVERF